MTADVLKTLTFEEKIRMLSEEEQSYLQKYVDQALSSFEPEQIKHPYNSSENQSV